MRSRSFGRCVRQQVFVAVVLSSSQLTWTSRSADIMHWPMLPRWHRVSRTSVCSLPVLAPQDRSAALIALGLDPATTPDATQVKRAFRKKVALLHPDLQGGAAEDSEEFMAVLDAYAVLSGRRRVRQTTAKSGAMVWPPRPSEDLEAKREAVGEEVWVRARVATVRVKGKSTFVVLRQSSLHTIQACKFKDAEDGGESATAVAKFFKSLPLESLVDLRGVIAEANVSSCTQSNVELQIKQVFCVSQAAPQLPFLIADAQRSEAEIEASQGSKRPFVRVLPDLRLDHRWLDLRVPAHNATLRIQSAICRLFRDSLTKRGFVEIHSPKLIAGESEGGAEVFRVDYFGSKASLAQSPQLYKQMAISADMPGAFEIGPVFRAENSNTPRHLCEFTGLDFEMPIMWHYNEVIQVIHETLSGAFQALEEECAEELKVVRQMYPSEAPKMPSPAGPPCILHWGEAMEMLQKAAASSGSPGRTDMMADLSTEEERLLGSLVLEKYGSDLFFLDNYPSAVRPFYTMPSKDQPEYSNSYDVIFRGQEIGSGAQRCHDPELLEARCSELGVPTEPLQGYIDSFRHGVSPHGGVGLGLERIVQLYLGLDNIRKAAMFTRDPTRLSP